MSGEIWLVGDSAGVPVVQQCLAGTDWNLTVFATDTSEPLSLLQLPGQDAISVRRAGDLPSLATCNELSIRQRSDIWLLSYRNMHIVKPTVLDFFGVRAINIHPGLLPEFAGLHSHQWAIRKGQSRTGVTAHVMESRVDTGDVVLRQEFEVGPDDTGLSTWRRSLHVERAVISDLVRQIVGSVPLSMRPQDLSRRRLYRSGEVGSDDLDPCQPAEVLHNWIRAANYFPFSSPSYRPRLKFADRDVTPLSSRVGPLLGGSDRAGTIFVVDGVLTVCCIDRYLAVTSGACDGRPFRTPEDLAAVLGPSPVG